MGEVGSTELIATDSSAIYDEVMSYLEEAVGEPLYPGDERRIFAEALVQVLSTIHMTIQTASRQTMLRYARGEVLDALAARLGVERLHGACARTKMRFTAGAPATKSIGIPAGTRATSDGTIYFETDADAQIAIGSTYVDVEATATVPGSAGNDYPAGTITALVDMVPYVLGCTNVAAASGGDDGEPYAEEGDDHLRQRVLLAPSKLSTAGCQKGYEYFAMSADASIADAHAISADETIERTLAVHDGHAFMGGELLVPESLTIDGAKSGYTYTYTDGLLDITLGSTLASKATVAAKITRKMDGRVKIVLLGEGGTVPSAETIATVSKAVSASDVRPLTDVVTVVAPTLVSYDIEVEYATRVEDEAACVEAVEGAGGAIERYIADQSSRLGRDINPDKLLAYIMRPDWSDDAVGAIYARIAKPEQTVLGDDQVAHFSGKLKVSHIVETGTGWS